MKDNLIRAAVTVFVAVAVVTAFWIGLGVGSLARGGDGTGADGKQREGVQHGDLGHRRGADCNGTGIHQPAERAHGSDYGPESGRCAAGDLGFDGCGKMRIIRVFPRRTSYTPEDAYVFIGQPPFRALIPKHDEVHVSCTFTWDKRYCEELAFQWEAATNKPVKLGGPAFGSPAEGFVPGLYIKPNIVFTTRGCNNNCPWCIVPKLEGKLKELPIYPGNWIQDNNFLQADRAHKDKVFEMLRTQKQICFKGGLEVDLIDDHFVNAITSLRIKELWLACDTDAQLPEFRRACEKLWRAGFSREKIKCYALSYGRDMEADEARCKQIYEAGAMPFMQLYRDFSEDKTEYSKEWNAFARQWQRPAAIKTHMEKGTDFRR